MACEWLDTFPIFDRATAALPCLWPDSHGHGYAGEIARSVFDGNGGRRHTSGGSGISLSTRASDVDGELLSLCPSELWN